MGYLHIKNLYADQRVLAFREVYALEKIHGTSAHISWKDGAVRFFSGGENHEKFSSLFDSARLAEMFTAIGHEKVTVYGEAYGGKCQGMSKTYGVSLRFVAFDVQVGATWLTVPEAFDVAATKLGLDFVAFEKVPGTVEVLNAERDRPSRQAVKNGVEGDKLAEGIVIRPPFEVTASNGERLIAKHKRDEFRETATPREVNPDKQAVLNEATKIAAEWVTPMRLAHVLDKLGPVSVESTKTVIQAMTEDITREAEGEIIDSPEARRAIGTATAQLFIARLKNAVSPEAAEVR